MTDPRDGDIARVVLRADAGTTMGAGHLMRCLSLGRAMVSRAEVMVVTRAGEPWIAGHVTGAGLRLVELAAPYPDPADADTVVQLVTRPGRDWVVVDGYHFDDGYLQALRAARVRTLVIDDQPRLPEYRVDALLDQNIGALRQPYRASAAARLLLGPQFALLRPQFGAAASRPVERPARHLLVALGGGDATNVTQLVLEAIRRTGDRFLSTILLGGANPHAAQLVRDFSGAPGLTFVQNRTNVIDAMAAADIAVASVGGVMWELASLGVPTLLIGTTDVQARVAAPVDAYGAHRWLGLASALTPEAIADELVALANDRGRRAEMSRLGRQLIDGHGATRVADAMLAEAPASDWAIRVAATEDAEAIWEIAADPDVRQLAFSADTFPYPAHEEWFLGRLARTDCRFWVGHRDGVVGGFVRYDADEHAAAISIAVAAPFRGYGLGSRLLADTWATACRELGADRARGVVFEENGASRSAFARAGFAEVERKPVGGKPCVVFEACPRDGAA